eukprot:41724-Chlamydomonas_euryale.AAC.1
MAAPRGTSTWRCARDKRLRTTLRRACHVPRQSGRRVHGRLCGLKSMRVDSCTASCLLNSHAPRASCASRCYNTKCDLWFGTTTRSKFRSGGQPGTPQHPSVAKAFAPMYKDKHWS